MSGGSVAAGTIVVDLDYAEKQLIVDRLRAPQQLSSSLDPA